MQKTLEYFISLYKKNQCDVVLKAWKKTQALATHGNHASRFQIKISEFWVLISDKAVIYDLRKCPFLSAGIQNKAELVQSLPAALGSSWQSSALQAAENTDHPFPAFFFQAEDGIRDFCLSRGLGDVYKRQLIYCVHVACLCSHPFKST